MVTVEEPKEVQLLLKSSLAASFFQCKLSVHIILASRRQLSLDSFWKAEGI